MKKKLLLWGLIFSVAVNISLITTIIVYSRRTQPSLVKELNLSGSQVKKIHSFRESYLNKVEKLQSELQKERTELTEILMKKEINPLIIDTKLQRIAFLQTQIQRETIRHLSRIEREVLTPQQRQKFFIIIRKQLLPERMRVEEKRWIKGNFSP